jgi:succinate dehydrogenase / fumarate reductase, iron-sulfur subunit
MAEKTFRVWRGNSDGGEFKEYKVQVEEGMVVLDVIHKIQAVSENDLAVRWNCKAGKCGSCSMEINGKPRLACMSRMDEYEDVDTLTIQPLKTFPIIRDLVTNVKWNYEQNKRIPAFKPGPKGKDGKYRMMQEDADRSQEFRKCIECFLCQTVCHVLRDQDKMDKFVGPRFMIRLATLEMHPLDTEDRIPLIKEAFGSGYCNITKCCTEVCPEQIKITDNAIIPLKERVVDRYYDPIMKLFSKFKGNKKKAT